MRVLVVGAGLYGAVCAQELRRRGHAVRVVEKREHIGGNVTVGEATSDKGQGAKN